MLKILKKIAITLLNLILAPIRCIIQKELEQNNQKEVFDLKLTLQRQANLTSVNYIQKNMRYADSVASRYELLSRALSCASLEGLIMEFGVYKGESINHISVLTNDLIYGFDSFDGLPERWRDGFGRDFFKIKELPKVNKNVILIKGWFSETIPNFIKETNFNVRFLHIDCDLYSSTKTIFDLLGDKIVVGTVIVFDEYFNYPGWQYGEFKAFKEFISNSGLSYSYIGYNRNHEQVAVRIEDKRKANF